MSKEMFFINAKLTVQGCIYDFQLDLEERKYKTHGWTLDDAIESIQEQFDCAVHDGDIVLADPEDIDLIDITEDMVEFDLSELPDFLNGDWDKISEFAEHYYSSYYDIDVFEAASNLGIPFSDVDEAYNGEHRSDEEFAENICAEIGYIPDDFPSWIAIDWEATARSIMYDYEEDNGHYFRRF